MSNDPITPAASTELAHPDAIDTASIVDAFRNNSASVYSSISGTDFASKTSIIKAITNAEDVSEHVGETFNLRNFVVQSVKINQPDGSKTDAVRTILIDDEGNALACVSDGIVKALMNFVGVLGAPEGWPSAVPVQVQEQKSRAGFRFMTLVLA